MEVGKKDSLRSSDFVYVNRPLACKLRFIRGWPSGILRTVSSQPSELLQQCILYFPFLSL